MNYQQYRPSGFRLLPPVVKNLLIINGLVFLATIALESQFGFDLVEYFGLRHWGSQHFKPYQFITHLFMHGGLMHLVSNMFALWMFGYALENVWGGKRFLIYYAITGLGAAVLHLAVNQYQIISLQSQMTQEQIALVFNEGYGILRQNQNFIDPLMGKLNLLYNIPTVGASGAVFGVLLAFGMLFPNQVIYLNFFFPIKAKYFVALYGFFELFAGIQNSEGDNIAHFAHLGGMLFGYFLIKYWNKGSRQF